MLHRFRDTAFDRSKIAIGYLATPLVFNPPESLGISSTTSRAHERYRQTTDGRAIVYSEREFTFAKNCVLYQRPFR